MNRFLRIAALVLAAGVVFSACSKDDGDLGSTDAENVRGDGAVNPDLLTGVYVYTGEHMKPKDGEKVSYSVAPYVDRDSGEVTFVTSMTVETEEVDENGEIQFGYDYRNFSVRADRDINMLERKELDLGEKIRPGMGMINKDNLVFMVSNMTMDKDSGGFTTAAYLHSIDLATGEHKISDELGSMLSIDSTWVGGIVTDDDGYIYISAETEVIVLNSDFVRQYSVPVTGYINSIAVSPDGAVLITQKIASGSVIYEIDKKAGRLSEEPVYSWDSYIELILFGAGEDRYFVNDRGIYGQSGDGEPELLMNYMNSDVNANDFEIMAVIDRDTVLASEDLQNENGFDSTTAALYRKTEDIDLSKIQTIEIAAVEEIDRILQPYIVSYNKNHRDIRVSITDYSQYSTKSDENGGAARLGSDMASGVYKPDIVLANRKRGGSVIDYLLSNDLFADYNEILSDKPEILEDMFGGIRRALTTSDGRMWGMTQTFTVSSLLTVDPSLMNKPSWTLEEMLDFNDSLPEGVVMLDGVTRESFFTQKSAFYYESFVDMENYTCDFENGTFYRLLDYIAGLPTDEEYETMLESGSYDDGGNYYAKYHEGKAALYPVIFRSEEGAMRNQVVFNTPDYHAIGYPTDGGYGSMAEPEDTYIITTWCENPDAAWDFIDSLVRLHDGERVSFAKYMYGIPAFRSVFDILCDFNAENNHIYKLYYSGSSGSISGELMTVEEVRESMDEPGIVTVFDRGEAEEYAEFLENRVGGGVATSIPADVMGIIGEEVSAYAAGVNDAEGCAGKIQSRVAIWLSEHE